MRLKSSIESHRQTQIELTHANRDIDKLTAERSNFQRQIAALQQENQHLRAKLENNALKSPSTETTSKFKQTSISPSSSSPSSSSLSSSSSSFETTKGRAGVRARRQSASLEPPFATYNTVDTLSSSSKSTYLPPDTGINNERAAGNNTLLSTSTPF